MMNATGLNNNESGNKKRKFERDVVANSERAIEFVK